MANQTPQSILSVFELVFVLICIAFVAYMTPYRHGDLGRLAAGIIVGLPLSMFPRLTVLVFARGRGSMWIIGCILACLFLLIVGLLGGFDPSVKIRLGRLSIQRDTTSIALLTEKSSPSLLFVHMCEKRAVS